MLRWCQPHSLGRGVLAQGRAMAGAPARLSPQHLLPRALSTERAPEREHEGYPRQNKGFIYCSCCWLMLSQPTGCLQPPSRARRGTGAGRGDAGAELLHPSLYLPQINAAAGAGPHLKSAGRCRGRRGPARGGRAGTCCRWGSACPAPPGARPPPSPWPSRPRARTRAPGKVSAPSGARPCRTRPAEHRGWGRPKFLPRAGASIRHPGPGHRRSGGLGLMLPGSQAG